MADRHIRRTGDDYGTEFIAYLPQGQAWPRETGTILDRACRGLANYYGYVDGRAADLLERESDPRATVELLPDWERNWGLPDPCYGQPMNLHDRQLALVLRMTMIGGQSRQFFLDVASFLGYTITISEYAPFMAGVSQAGDTRSAAQSAANPGGLKGDFRWYIGPPQMRFYWTVHVTGARLTWFRCAQSEAGVDHHLEIGLAKDLECLLDRWKPAHTQIVFDYSNIGGGSDPMAGTP